MRAKRCLMNIPWPTYQKSPCKKCHLIIPRYLKSLRIVQVGCRTQNWWSRIINLNTFVTLFRNLVTRSTRWSNDPWNHKADLSWLFEGIQTGAKCISRQSRQYKGEPLRSSRRTTACDSFARASQKSGCAVRGAEDSEAAAAAAALLVLSLTMPSGSGDSARRAAHSRGSERLKSSYACKGAGALALADNDSNGCFELDRGKSSRGFVLGASLGISMIEWCCEF